jgi:hypothetical protein
MPTPLALHSKKTPNWGTPRPIIEIARQLLDNQIHLDPASSPEFNTLVQAMMIYTDKDNGLVQPWIGNVFCNPPGGLVKEFWLKLVESVKSGQVQKAFWVGFSVEQLCLLADLDFYPLDFSSIILRKRLAFNTQDLVSGGAPSHGNYLTGIGVDPDLFNKLFAAQGKIIHGSLT